MIDPDDAPRFTKAELLGIEPPDTRPADFTEFWETTYAAARALDLNIETRPLWSPDDGVEIQEVYYTSWDGFRIGAWITRPAGSTRGMVVGHGYGGRDWFDMEPAEAGYTAIFPCIRGFHLSSHPDLPWRANDHVTTGIQTRDTYILRGSVADLWLAASVLNELYPECSDSLCYNGGSFGGGLGALMLPWDSRFCAAHLGVPTFGHHPRRLGIPSTGSGEGVRNYWLSHREVEEVLAYYDAATAASGIRIPTLCSPALFDPAVTPPGQFAVANAIPDAELFILPAGHYDYPDLAVNESRLKRRIAEFFLEHLG